MRKYINNEIMKLAMILMLLSITLLLLGGVPGVIMYIQIQGISIGFPATLMENHWFTMIFGFFGALSGNELFSPLSYEWAGRVANIKYILSYTIMLVLSILTQQLGFYLASHLLVLLYFIVQIIYSRVYLKPSKIGLKPHGYNYLIFVTLL
jgi:hypothetical protein